MMVDDINQIKERYIRGEKTIKKSYNMSYKNQLKTKIYDIFKFLEKEEALKIIKKEYEKFNTDFILTVPPDDVHKKNLWKFIPLICNESHNITVNGSKIDFLKNFKNTISLIKDNLPENEYKNILMTGFSILKPTCKLDYHTGYFNNLPHNSIFRIHLPVNIPKQEGEEIYIELFENENENGYGKPLYECTEKHTWKEGELFIFDDSFKHCAVNNTKEDRVIIIIDYYIDNTLNKFYHIECPVTGKKENIKRIGEIFFSDLIENYSKRGST
jgi:hypothetical protein